MLTTTKRDRFFEIVVVVVDPNKEVFLEQKSISIKYDDIIDTTKKKTDRQKRERDKQTES